MDYILNLFEKYTDKDYALFQAKLIPNLDVNDFIGVRTPDLRKLAKEVAKQPEASVFLKELPHRYFDENQLHSFILSDMKDFDACIVAVETFLPYIDNWATCDQLSPKVFKKNKQALLPHIDRWLSSSQTYTIRFGIEMLMSHFLDEDFDAAYLEKVGAIKSDEYYINMMIAWYFATALAKQWDATISYVEAGFLDKWVHNKTIQKARESYRITADQKEYLKSIKK